MVRTTLLMTELSNFQQQRFLFSLIRCFVFAKSLSIHDQFCLGKTKLSDSGSLLNIVYWIVFMENQSRSSGKCSQSKRKQPTESERRQHIWLSKFFFNMMIYDKLFFLKRSVWCGFEFSILLSFFELFAENYDIFDGWSFWETHIYIYIYFNWLSLFTFFHDFEKNCFQSEKNAHSRRDEKIIQKHRIWIPSL